jgi:hypothetical protein
MSKMTPQETLDYLYPRPQKTRLPSFKWWLAGAVVALFLLFCWGLAQANEVIDLSVIVQIESSGNPYAYNPRTKAHGLYQILKICLIDYNNYHAKKYTLKDLYNPAKARKVADWYLHHRIPEMLKFYGKERTIENILICYNAGIKYAVKRIKPRETRNYIKKYKRLARR